MGVGAIIGAVIGGGAFAAGSTLFGASLMASALTGAALGNMFDRRGAASSPTYGFTELENTRSQALPIPVIYGRVKVGGNIIYHRVSDDSKTIYMAVGLGEGEISGVSDIRANDIPIEDIKGAEWRVYVGTADQPADPWVHTGERWPHTAYIVAKFQANDQITTTPTITCVVDGLKVPIWNGSKWDVQYTNNPAWVLLDFLRSKRYGVGIEDDRIDFASFATEAAYCDDMVPDGNGSQEPRFRLDYTIDYEAPSLDVIEDMLATFRAYLLYSDGKLRLKVEKSEVPVHAFGMNNIVHGSFTYSKASRKDIPNRVVAEWVDPQADYERVETAYDNEIDQDRRGEVYSRTVTLLGVTRPGQAGRMARFYHDSAYWANTFCEFRVGIDALHCEVGDVVQVSHDVPGWEQKLFRILEIEEGEDDEAILRCREYVPAIYHDRGVVYQPGKETTLPNPVAAPPHVTGLEAVSASRTMGDGSVEPVIRVTWVEPTAAYYAGAIVYWRKTGAPAWQRSQLSEAPSYDILLAEPGEYEVRVVSVSQSGVRAAFETAPEVNVHVSMTIPANVTGLVVDFTGPDAVARWNPVPHVHKYRVRILDATTDQVKRIEEVTGTTYTYPHVYNVSDFGGSGSPTIKVSVEARNEAGNYSAVPTVLLAINAKPAQPMAHAESSLTQLRWQIASDVPDDFKAVKVEVGSFSQVGAATSGVIDLVTAGIDDGQQVQVAVSIIDVFGQESDPRLVSVSAVYATDRDLAGSVFEVEYVSEQFPSGADPTVLYDNDPTTGITFTQAPTITVRHPKEERFGMVALHIGAAAQGYVQVRRHGEETWTSVIGTPGSPHAFDAGENVVAFAGNRIVVAREVRIVLLSPVRVNEFTPSVYVVANHILGGTMTLTQGMAIRSEDGRLDMTPSSFSMKDSNGNPLLEIEGDQAQYNGNLGVRTIKAENYAEIRNNLVFSKVDSLDEDSPMEMLFYIPSETTEIVAAYLVAQALPFRAYSKGTYGGGGTVQTTDETGDHYHTLSIYQVTGISTGTGYTGITASSPGHSHTVDVSGVTDSAGEHSHSVGVSGNTSYEWGHSHTVDVSGSTDSEGSHSHSVHAAGMDSWGEPITVSGYTSSDGDHSHSLSATGSTSSDGGHDHTVYATGTAISAGAHTHTVSLSGGTNSVSVTVSITDPGHTHSYHYYLVGNPMGTEGSHSHTVSIPDHDHGIVFGIYEDTTPAGVTLGIDNGAGVGPAIPLAQAPANAYESYDLIAGATVAKHNDSPSEMDLTQLISGTGWKRLRFTSTRLGRIEAHLVLKLDLTA